MPVTALTLAVVGAKFPNKRGMSRLYAINMCRPGESVQLVPEPKNPGDPRAVMILDARGVQMGYVSAERAPWIGRLISEGIDLKPIFQERTEWGALIRVSLDDNFPDLPPARDSVDREADFFPDEIFPDD